MTELAIIVHYIRAVKRLDTARNMLRNAAERMNNSGPSSTMTNNTCEEAAYESLRLFEEGMSDDLNAPRASSGLFHLVKAAEKVSFFFLCICMYIAVFSSTQHLIFFYLLIW